MVLLFFPRLVLVNRLVYFGGGREGGTGLSSGEFYLGASRFRFLNFILIETRAIETRH